MSASLGGLAMASLRHRRTACAATFVSVLLGAVLIGAFATLAQTATGDVSDADAETLTIMGLVVGAWGSLIVLFSVASTLTITVRQRAEEIGLLRIVGATPRQARRIVLAEASVVTIVAAVLGAAIAWPAGFLLLALLRSGGMVADDVAYGGGAAALGGTAALLVLTSLIASAVTARRTTSGPATLAIAEARSGVARMPWWRTAGRVRSSSASDWPRSLRCCCAGSRDSAHRPSAAQGWPVGSRRTTPRVVPNCSATCWLRSSC